MRIEGNEAVTMVLDTRLPAKDVQSKQPAEGYNVPLAAELEENDYKLTDKAVLDAVDRVNRAISGTNRQFKFSVHEKTNRIMVKVIDTETKEVIREIPPEKILDMVGQMWEMAGILVDERR